MVSEEQLSQREPRGWVQSEGVRWLVASRPCVQSDQSSACSSTLVALPTVADCQAMAAVSEEIPEPWCVMGLPIWHFEKHSLY